MKTNLVDLLLATYNGARYLSAQLDSILLQTHQDFRVLVSDDGSSDDTLATVESYRARFGERLILLTNPSPGRGVVRNFENLMAASLQDGVANWAAFCDQDDVWMPRKIERSLAEMRRIEVEDGKGGPCLVHSDLTVVDQNLELICPSFTAYQSMNPGQCTPTSLLSMNQVTGCTAMVNRALLKMALPLPREVIMHDWWCALVSGSGRRSFIAAPQVLYRQHGGNQVGARSARFGQRLLDFKAHGLGELRRVRAVGRSTYLQASALRQRLRSLEMDETYVSRYLEWREKAWWRQIADYRSYYMGPELNRFARFLVWSRALVPDQRAGSGPKA